MKILVRGNLPFESAQMLLQNGLYTQVACPSSRLDLKWYSLGT